MGCKHSIVKDDKFNVDVPSTLTFCEKCGKTHEIKDNIKYCRYCNLCVDKTLDHCRYCNKCINFNKHTSCVYCGKCHERNFSYCNKCKECYNWKDHCYECDTCHEKKENTFSCKICKKCVDINYKHTLNHPT